MLYEVIVMRSRADTSAEGSTVFRTVVDVDSLDEAAIDGLQAMHREGIAPLKGPKLVVEITAMEGKPT
jgi:hypothetical protein